MPNGRKEPWEQLGYIADIGSRVVTKDPLSSLMEPGSPFWQWINNETAYAKAEDAVDTAHQNTMERDRADSKDAMKLQKVRGTQSMAELAQQHTNAEELDRRETLRTNLETMRQQAELDPYGAYDRLQIMLADPELPEDMRGLVKSTGDLFQQKKERKDARIALVEELLPYTSSETVTKYTQKDFNSKIAEKFSDGIGKLNPSERLSYQRLREDALKTAGATGPFQQKLYEDKSREYFARLGELQMMTMPGSGIDPKDLTMATQIVDKLRSDVAQIATGKYEDLAPEVAASSKFYEAEVLLEGYDKETIKEEHPEAHQRIMEGVADKIELWKDKDSKGKVTTISPEKVPTGVFKASNQVVMKGMYGEDMGKEITVSGPEAKKLQDAGTHDVVRVAYVEFKKPITRERVEEVARLTPGFAPTYIPPGATVRFPASVTRGMTIKAKDTGDDYKVMRVLKPKGEPESVVLRNLKTGKDLQPIPYAEFAQKFGGIYTDPSLIETTK